ncbi:DUF2683 family protein [Candidatus Woesearchaeota archaeon]|nr:DUF2683 family protein [Candidatus Woesearchaeota archaeon]
MVQAMVDLEEKTNRVLNVVKAKYGLKDKSRAIDLVVQKYGESILELELRPEYVEQAQRIHKQTSIKVGTLENLKKRYEK